MKPGHMLWLLVLVSLLAACGRSTVVRRERVYEPPRHTAGVRVVSGAREYVVVRGDTLYGIAFRHGLDYRDIAAWNGIRAPYTIYPGQSIRLTPHGRRVAAAPAPTSRPAPVSAPPASRPPASAPARPAPPADSPPPARPTTPAPAPPAATGPVRWQWPAQGQIVGRYVAGDPTKQGIDIAGNGGQPVNAAADGVVVYSGAGLVGYGELIIVKHTDEWLSAYGHNRRRLVEEGQQVRAGQQIAEMGRTGASRDMLHFEIRRNGKPVDPLQHLPPR